MRMRMLVMFAVALIGTTAGVQAQDPAAIVFSKSMIDANNPAGLTTEFAAGDPIYAMARLDKTVLDIVGKATAKAVDVEVFLYELKPPLYDYQQPSEMQIETGSLKVSGGMLSVKNLPLDIVPSPGSMTAYGSAELTYKKFGPQFAGPVKFAAKLSQLDAGKHEIIVKLRCNYAFVAEGRFTINGDFAQYSSASSAINDAACNIKDKAAVMPKAKKSDKKLEKEMIGAFKGSQTYKSRIKGDVLRVVIIDPDWMVRRHPVSGVILHRYIRAAFAVKNKDGSCTVWNLVTFQQDYVSGTFQATKFDGVGDPYSIPCGSVRQ